MPMALRRILRILLSAGVIFSVQVLAEELCPGAGPVELPMRRPGSSAADACNSLRILLPVVTRCAAEYSGDRDLKIHAAGILLLERQAKIDLAVLTNMRQMLQNSQRMPALNMDPAASARTIERAETAAAKTEAELAEKRKNAAAAGYGQLSEAGAAQKIISSAVWRYIETGVRYHIDGCTDEAGRQAALAYIGNIGVMMSHGEGLEREIIRLILSAAPK